MKLDEKLLKKIDKFVNRLKIETVRSWMVNGKHVKIIKDKFGMSVPDFKKYTKEITDRMLSN